MAENKEMEMNEEMNEEMSEEFTTEMNEKMNSELNTEISDEDLEEVSGGKGWSKEWWKKYSHTKPKFGPNAIVVRFGYRQYGIAEVKGISYMGKPKKGTFVYNIDYAGQPWSVSENYGRRVPENQLGRS